MTIFVCIVLQVYYATLETKLQIIFKIIITYGVSGKIQSNLITNQQLKPLLLALIPVTGFYKILCNANNKMHLIYKMCLEYDCTTR